MATIKRDISIKSANFPSSNFPQLKNVMGSNFPVFGLYFDASTEEKCYFEFKAVGYGSGNITANLQWYADSASSGDIVWGAKLAAITPNTDTQDVETKALATQQTVTDSHLATTGQRLHECSITISNLDSIASGDAVWLEISRVAANGSDTMTGDAVLTGLEITYSDT